MCESRCPDQSAHGSQIDPTPSALQRQTRQWVRAFAVVGVIERDGQAMRADEAGGQ